MQDLRGENFQNVSGAQLCQMSAGDFTKLEPKFGETLFDVFQKLLADGKFWSTVALNINRIVNSAISSDKRESIEKKKR